jgi:hypothetical protein
MNYNYYQGMPNLYNRSYGNANYPQQPQYQSPYQPQVNQQMQQPMQQQPMQYEQPIQATILYATLKEAESQIVYPNTKIVFIDKDKGMIYFKGANNDGQSFMKYYKEIEVTDNGEPRIEKQEEKVDYSIFATKEQLNGFVSVDKYNELLDKIEQLKKQIGGKNNGGTRN